MCITDDVITGLGTYQTSFQEQLNRVNEAIIAAMMGSTLTAIQHLLTLSGKEWSFMEDVNQSAGTVYLRPKQLDLYKEGTFTLEDLIDWSYGRGAVIK